MVKLTSLDSPGPRVTRSKPLSCLTGRVTLPTRSRMYIWTVSVPSRLPLLRTVTVALMEPPPEKLSDDRLMAEYSKSV